MLTRLITTLRQLFSSNSRPAQRPKQAPRPTAVKPAEQQPGPGEPQPFPEARAWNPDFATPESTLSPRERNVLQLIDKAVADGQYALPRLPSSVQKLMRLAANPQADMAEIADTLSTDPSLSSETFKAANSVLLGGAVQCDSLRQAVSRLGIRRLRSVVFAMSMRSAILRDKALLEFAEEIWRQASSVAQTASEIAKRIGMDPDSAYLMGLTHDIGKVALLGILSKQKSPTQGLSGAFLGTMFVRHHEAVGAAMAQEWELPEEVIAIAGHHHKPHTNPTHPREASLVFLAHRMDQLISMGAEDDYQNLVTAEEMDTLGLEAPVRQQLLDSVLASALGQGLAPAASEAA